MVFLTHTKKIQSKTVRGCCEVKKTGHQFQSIASTQIVRQWMNSLSRTTNKTSLIAFLVSEWKSTQHREQLGDKVLYATVSEVCFKITSEECMQVPYLQCNQEEADG